MVAMKTVWNKVKAGAGVTGRWHDSWHTFITDLAESGEASERDDPGHIAGHVSKQMLKHYSHIRMGAKRRAVASLGRKPEAPKVDPDSIEVPKDSPQSGFYSIERKLVSC
jgi:hypothetical protein